MQADITRPFPFNAFGPEDSVPDVALPDNRLKVSGLVENKGSWSLENLRRLPQVAQVTQHICIAGWSVIGEWSGIPFRTFLERIGADLTARYIGFKCADRYCSSLGMPHCAASQDPRTRFQQGPVAAADTAIR